MDSGSTGNYVSENLVSFLNLSTEDLASPYHVRWVNHEARTLVTKRCLVEFSIGCQYEDKIWCDVMRMDSCHILLGRPWQCDRNVYYRGRENVYELKVNGEPIKLFPKVEKMKRERILLVEEKAFARKQRVNFEVSAKDSRSSLFQPGEDDADWITNRYLDRFDCKVT
ncbi:hypothetical protein RHMOL_Rhmol05G0115200 [Rhododendron molle]|uniref:Uncharacterized protein n=1 Tax=Rhododendron molle TaxID=49168 RepID=A0ACC0NMZ5_RHOML|nr:hypothetical protein RHMOL_Rhmol05G0115200 [Rhododendron molle]